MTFQVYNEKMARFSTRCQKEDRADTEKPVTPTERSMLGSESSDDIQCLQLLIFNSPETTAAAVALP